MKNYVKFIYNNYFLKMFQFLLISPIDIITSAISSTQFVCDVMCEQYVIQQFLQQKNYFFYKEFFL